MRRRPSGRRVGRRQRPPAAPNVRAVKRDPELAQEYEVETVVGLEEYARREIRRRLGKSAQLGGAASEGRIALRYDGSARRFDELRTVTAVHRVENFAVPRPRALLGHQHLTRLLTAARSVIEARRADSCKTFRVVGAGAGSRVFARIRQEIAAATGLEPTDDAAHLQIAIRRASKSEDGWAEDGWQALIRTSPLPLSARRWRVRDMPGALNATVASVMVSLAGARPAERLLNLCCGSGTLMVERLGMGSAAGVTGVDISADALRCADANLRAAGHRSSVSLVQADCANLPLPDASVDTITADLPYGMLQSGGGDIASLYHSALDESARVGRPDASLVVITTRRRAMMHALDEVSSWNLSKEIPLSIPYSRGYITPRIYLLKRGKDFRPRL